MTTKTQQFWDYFIKNINSFTFINKAEPTVKENLLNSILNELHHYCDSLYFEISDDPEGTHELIITAEGKAEYFEEVENLINAAPRIEHWNFVAFIPPRDIHFNLRYEGLVLNPEDMWFMPLSNDDDPKAIGISICAKDYELVQSHDFFESAMFKILDVLLGEKSAAIDLDFVSFGHLPDDPVQAGMIELAELPDYIKWKKKGA